MVIGAMMALGYTIKILTTEWSDLSRTWGMGNYGIWAARGAIIQVFGILFILIGSIGRPPNIWIPLIVVGIICVFSFSGGFIDTINIHPSMRDIGDYERIMLCWIPGALCLLEGIILGVIQKPPALRIPESSTGR